jgi:hypothetical protein
MLPSRLGQVAAYPLLFLYIVLIILWCVRRVQYGPESYAYY